MKFWQRFGVAGKRAEERAVNVQESRFGPDLSEITGVAVLSGLNRPTGLYETGDELNAGCPALV